MGDHELDCKTAVFFCERERRTIFERKAGASEKTARENGERRFTLEDHAYGAARLPKTTVLQSNMNIHSCFIFGYKKYKLQEL